MGLFKKLFGRSSKFDQRTACSTHRDYARELMDDPQSRDYIKGTLFVCTLDERTCLKCLELDGSQTPPKLPVHEGCRCVTVPVLKSWRELGIGLREAEAPAGTRASAIGQVRSDGGVYKAYLIERARAIEKGLNGDDFARHLQDLLPLLERRYPEEVKELAAIRAAVFALSSNDDLSEIESILQKIVWNSGQLQPLIKRCAELGGFDLIDKTLSRLVKEVPRGEYTSRHKGMLYRNVGDAVKKESLSKAIRYYEQAAMIDSQNTAVAVELGKLYRRNKQPDKAKEMFEKVLRVNPGHKEARKEIARL